MKHQSGIATIALILALTGCGGDDEATSSAKEGSGGTSSSTDAALPTGDDSAASLPEGFPEDIPLPEGAILKAGSVVGGGAGWRLLYQIDLDDDDRLDRYTKRLADAGFEINTEVASKVNIDAFREPWKLDAVVRAPTITLQVLDYK